jgi:predicted acylesterase/phospholipase RssA
MRPRAIITWLLTGALLSGMAGCAPTMKRNPVPEALVDRAHVPGFPDVRLVGTESAAAYSARLLDAHIEQAKASGLADKPHHFLALSGGGPDGAFGAGLLVGWTAAGDRPEFSHVTGISTGALIAPFAFLGSAYDHVLRDVYTGITTEDVLEKRGVLAGLRSDAFTDSAPLRRLIAKHVDADVVAAIAREHRRGRRLYVGTTDVDRLEQVHWNIGAIATSGHPQAKALVHDILLASASIPTIFPPVYFEVEADGQRYDEMHVDGGVSSQVFAYPLTIKLRQLLREMQINPDVRLYVIRNSRLAPAWSATKPKLFSIAGRSISGLLATQGAGDLYEIYLGALRDEIDFNLAYIPASFKQESNEPFDPEYMQALYDLGYKMAESGYPWDKTPPGYAAP